MVVVVVVGPDVINVEELNDGPKFDAVRRKASMEDPFQSIVSLVGGWVDLVRGLYLLKKKPLVDGFALSSVNVEVDVGW